MKTIITIGTGYSGSSAIYELLSKCEIFNDPFPNKEFSLIYDPGSILDIEDKILRNKTINQVNFIISQFQRNLYYYINADNSSKPGKDYSNKSEIKKIYENYLNMIIDFEYTGESTFMKHQKNFIYYLKSKFYEKLKLKKINKIVSLVDHKKFLDETQKFLDDLFFLKSNVNKIILDQGGAITNLYESTKFYRNPYIILVYRDPRDIFSEFKQKSAYSYPKEDVNVFCKWYKKLIDNINNQKIDRINVLKIKFEDFVLKHEFTVNKISSFIEEDIHNSIKKFNLDRSKKNVFKYKKLLNDFEILKIEKQLKEHLY